MSAYLPIHDPTLSHRRMSVRLARQGAFWRSLIVGGALLALSLWSARSAFQETPPLAALPANSAGANAALALRGTHVERAWDYLILTGEATNISARPLTQVEAVVEFFDRGGRLRMVETALLELPDVRPGEESPFRVQTPDEPGLTTYRVRFRRLLGPTIPSREAQ